MTIAQVWKNEGELKGKIEGRIEGEHNKARLMVLRGRWVGAETGFLEYLSELPLREVNDIFEGYDEVYAAWQNNRGISRAIAQTKYLSEAEVAYLLDLFFTHNRWV